MRHALLVPLVVASLNPCVPAAARRRDRPAPATPLACPQGSLALQSGSHVLRERCTIAGDVALSGDAALSVEGTTFAVDGRVTLAGSSVLRARDSVFTIANHFVLEHGIEARDRAVLDLRDCYFNSNAGTVLASLATQYIGRDSSLLRLENVQISPRFSWLLADFYDHAELRVIDCEDIPSENYPHDSSTITIEGPRSKGGAWLEFPAGSKATLRDIPPRSTPFTFGFGRDTPGTRNIGYQVNIVNARASFGVRSMPGSDLTIENNGEAVTIGYLFSDVDAPHVLDGIHPALHNMSLNTQGRSFKLVNAVLDGYGWLFYAENPNVTAPHPVTFNGCTINELGVTSHARFVVNDSNLQWAVLGAVGTSSSIEVHRSVVNSQTIMAAKNARIRIDSSSIHGALVQAREDSRVVLLNNALRSNVCHDRCLPECPAAVPGACNPFSPPGEDVRFVAEGNASIVVAGIDPIATPVPRGEALSIVGDVLVESAGTAPRTYSWNLFHLGPGDEAPTPIVTNAAGSRRGASLGTLDTGTLAAGAHTLVLELRVAGVPPYTVHRPFTIAGP